MTPFHIVSPHVAHNPVARAIAKRKLQSAMLDFQLRIHLLRDGESVAADVHTGAQALTVCLMAMDRAGFGMHAAMSVMRGAQSALLQCAARGNRWRELDAVAIDAGLAHAMELYPQLPAEAVTQAWVDLRAIEGAWAHAQAIEAQHEQRGSER